MPNKFTVTIDGPARTGKTTMAKAIASRPIPGIGFQYIDTGAFYRTAAWQLLDKSPGLAQQIAETYSDPGAMILKTDQDGVMQVLSGIRISACYDTDKSQRMRAEPAREHASVEYPPEQALRTQAVSHLSSVISAFPDVRSYVSDAIRNFANGLEYAVCEGRDAGTALFPCADLKFYLYANPDVRAARSLRAGGRNTMSVPISDFMAERARCEDRDRRDSTRQHSPLAIPKDAIWIDTSDMEADKVEDLLCGILTARLDTKFVPVC